ncbi:MAG: CCA tRNA nucleotidyltransferase [Acidobacteriota bacterium]|nr:CCA tRNA nucleotidyltransferase [Acidobacteriota bacterium]
MRQSAPQYAAALAIVRTLRNAGHQAYFAGGCVRDLLLGTTPKDYDVATSAIPDQIVNLFLKTHTVGAHFGVVLVCTPQPGEPDIATEVATFRSDGAYSDGRRPDAVRYTSDPREDVLRRDFTINGMLLDPLAYEATGDLHSAVLDYVGGRHDLSRGVVRAIGDPNLRYAEDKLRLLRAVRFAARLNFHLEVEGIRCKSADITQVSAERIREELTRILTEGGAARGFDLLYQLGLLARILPEVVRLRGVAQPPEFHPEGDVWVHTMLLLEKLQPAAEDRVPHPFADSSRKGGTQTLDQPSANQPVSSTLAWGALLHDIGKPATYQPPNPKIAGDRIRFNGHVEVGVRIAEDILARLRFSNDDSAQILALIKNHMRFGDILQMKQSTLKRFLRLPRFEEHLELHRLDASSAHGDLRLYDFARAQFEAEPEPDLRPAPLLTGDDLIAAGYSPSPQFKPMLALAEDAQLEGAVTTRDQALTLVESAYPLAVRGERA